MMILDSALEYCQKGYSVIPVNPDYDETEKKFLKRPYIKWAEFQKRKATEIEIKSWWKQWPSAMIGVVTGDISKIAVIDCDSPEAYDHIQTLLPDSFLTPIARTPRGGYHIWFHANGTEIKNATSFLPKTDCRGEGGYIIAPPSQNSLGGTYQWIDGLSFLEASLQEMPNNIILSLGGDYKGGNEVSAGTQYYKDYTILQAGRRDQDLFKIGMALADGRYGRGELVQVLEILAKNCNPPFPEKELAEKIKSVFGRISAKDRNLMDEVREWCLLQEGYMNTTLIRHELHITTKQEIKNLSVIMNRLQDDGLIEKYGEKRGEYRVKKLDTSKMDLVTEETVEDVAIKLPLDLNEMCVLSPGNIVIVAGSKSSGKTAMLMNIAWLNQENFDIVYLNSEMSQTEFKKRMKKFAPLNRWKITGHKCHNNFDDYITGEREKIFFVDYLEINDNFYEIGKPIRKIHEKIGNSLCFIAIQMKAGASLGRGGDFSAEKSRLYLTMDYHPDEKHTKVTIYDAKEPRPPHDNVRGKFRRVKIIDGHRLSAFENWKW